MLLSYTPWKHQKTFRFSDIFRGYRKATLGCNGLKKNETCLSEWEIWNNAPVFTFVSLDISGFIHITGKGKCIQEPCQASMMEPFALKHYLFLLEVSSKMFDRNFYPTGIYLLKVDNRNSRTRCEIWSKLALKTPERRHWRRSGVLIVNF